MRLLQLQQNYRHASRHKEAPCSLAWGQLQETTKHSSAACTAPEQEPQHSTHTLRNQRGRCRSAIRGIAGGNDACDAGKKPGQCSNNGAHTAAHKPRAVERDMPRGGHGLTTPVPGALGFPHTHTWKAPATEASPVHSMQHPAHATYTHILLAMPQAALLHAVCPRGCLRDRGRLHALKAVHSTAQHSMDAACIKTHTPSRGVLAQNKPRTATYRTGRNCSLHTAAETRTHAHTPALRHTHTPH